MPNDITESERSANFVFDPETDRVVHPIRPGMRLVRATRPDGVAQYRIESWGRLPDDLDAEPNRWVTIHAGPEQLPPDLAIRWAKTAADKPPERPFLAMGLRPGSPSVSTH
ncbi:MAG: hypothetical protein BroJett003_01210 [Planctomycetota bacterium]|nr:MAG: hypothetical protein BroJett003_01210 [Planctomycetota bacterium]